MAEIADTPLGGNALLAGLIGHVAACLAAMLAAPGAGSFGAIVFPSACLLLVLGAYVELKKRGYAPISDWRIYVIAALTLLPFLGPLAALGLLYRFQKSGETVRVGILGLLSALFRMKANVLVLLALLIVLFLFYALLQSRQDPYFQRRAATVSLPAISFGEAAAPTPLRGG